MVNNIGNLFVKTDSVCDYIPIVSSLNNLTDLFQKCVIIPFMRKQTITNSHYYAHLKNKSILRCVVLLIPIIGNIFVGIYDFVKRNNDKKSLLAAVQKNGLLLQYASRRLKDDKKVVLEAVQQNGLALQYASGRLKGDKEVVLAAVQQNGWALQYASKKLKDEDVAHAAFEQNLLALQYTREAV